jgi:DNA-binding GntR family transcriptional regulator
VSSNGMRNNVVAIKEESDGPLANKVFDHLLNAIYQGKLAPGSIINEVSLANEFGVSRGPVREAIRRLQGIQLITREPYVKARVMSLSAQSALELFQMRMALEGVAAGLAAKHMTDSEIAALLAEMEQDRQLCIEDPQGSMELRVFDFHESVVRAGRNQRIINALCGDLYHLLRMYRRHSGAVLERKDNAYAEHWQILRAIKSRDSALAESLMRSHIERAANHLFKQLIDEMPSKVVSD